MRWWTLGLFSFAMAMGAVQSASADICYVRATVVCSSYESAAASLVLIGGGRDCGMLRNDVMVSKIEQRGRLTKVVAQAQDFAVTGWIKSDSIECIGGGSAPSSLPIGWTATKPKTEITADNFVWLDGKRVGYVDSRGPTLYRIEQLQIQGGSSPVPKAGEQGQALSAINVAEQVDRYIRFPEASQGAAQQSKYERTGDGFVWRDGKRIGWVSGSTFYLTSMLEISGESVKPKAGQAGVAIVSGDLGAAVAEIEKRHPVQ